MGSIEVAKVDGHGEVDETAKGHGSTGNHSDAKEGKPNASGLNVPTTFKEIFTFNSAIMGFGANLWMQGTSDCWLDKRSDVHRRFLIGRWP